MCIPVLNSFCVRIKGKIMEKILGFIGLAKRAGAVSVGTFVCETSIKSQVSKLIIIASDASEKSKKSIIDACKYYKVPFLEFSDKESLGRFTGGGEKVVISVNDQSFAKAIYDKIDSVQRKDR